MNDKNAILLDKLVRRSTMLYVPFDSSAQMFDEKIRQYVNPPFQLFYNYRFPENLSPRDFEYQVQRLCYILGVEYRRQITDTKNYYKDITHLGMDNAINDLDDALVKQITSWCDREIQDTEQILGHLDDDGRVALADWIDVQKKNAHDIACDNVTRLKDLNPLLKCVRVDMTNDLLILDFLMGVNYGFAPEDIDYFLNTPMDQRNRDAHIFDPMGFYPGYMIRPDRAEKIVGAVLSARDAMNKTKDDEK